jgi:SAM-dependent methyltransferase
MDLRERPVEPFRRHPWEAVRCRFFCRVLERDQLLSPTTRVLDVGAGDAFIGGEIARQARARVLCWDAGYDDAALRSAPPDGVALVASRPADRFDLVLLLDVLEHVDDDAAFLREVVAENLGDGGHALVSVPAWPRLFSRHDVRLGHRRRYTPARARALCESGGLEVLRKGGLFASLVVVRFAEKAAEMLSRRDARADTSPVGRWRGGPRLTRIVEAALHADARTGCWLGDRGVHLPGLSWWALCKKRPA